MAAKRMYKNTNENTIENEEALGVNDNADTTHVDTITETSVERPYDTASNISMENPVDMFVEKLNETIEEKPPQEPGDVETVLSDINKSVNSLSGNVATGVKVHVKKNTFSLSDKIPCKSLFHGKLVYTSPTNGSRYVWNEYGAVQHVPLMELETMNNHRPEILNKPLLLILEPTVVEDFNFGDVYRKVASFNKLGSFYKTGRVDVIRVKVKELVEVGMRDSVIADARKRRKENTLVDINIINMLNFELKCDIG